MQIKRGHEMNELFELKERVDMLFKKQNEIIQRMNLLIAKMNTIPKDIEDEKEALKKKAMYFEAEIDRVKTRLNMPDDDI